MRGASALDHWLTAHPGTDAFVVWEPVLDGDSIPAAAKLAAHAHNYWDPDRTRSRALKVSGSDPKCLASGSADVDAVWDAVFDYAAGSDTPSDCGRTILQKLPTLR